MNITSLSVAIALLLWIVLTYYGQPNAIAITIAVTTLTGILWVTEEYPIPVTSMIPFVLFPATGILTYNEAASALGNHAIILLMGAFMLSKAIQKSGVHKRFALYVISITGGTSGRRLLFAFIITSAILSMWISNTATTLMMLPIALVIIGSVDDEQIATPLLLGIAYGSSLGGICTPVGTPPNIIFFSVYSETMGREIDFLQWMSVGLPIAITAIPVLGFWLSRNLKPIARIKLPDKTVWHVEEKRVLVVFLFIIILWVSRPYWAAAFDITTVGDSTIALAGVLIMFLTNKGGGEKGKLLDWETAKQIHWGVLLLFASGICIAKAFMSSGLTLLISDMLATLSWMSLIQLIFCICISVTFLTEFTSNTATATLLMPILLGAGVGMGLDPKILMMPAAISSSCAFMLPVATAPNAIVYGTGYISIKRMAKEGLILNIFVSFIITFYCYILL
ncbi:MAG: SLC13 family permease [Chlamydiota bacterium]